MLRRRLMWPSLPRLAQHAVYANFRNSPSAAELRNSTSHFAGLGLLGRPILSSPTHEAWRAIPSRDCRGVVYANFRNFPPALKLQNSTSQLAGFASRHNLAFQYLLPKKYKKCCAAT